MINNCICISHGLGRGGEVFIHRAKWQKCIKPTMSGLSVGQREEKDVLIYWKQDYERNLHVQGNYSKKTQNFVLGKNWIISYGNFFP